MAKIKAIIFDADGMIFTGPLFSVRLAKEYNIDYKKVLPFFENEFKLCLVGKADLKEEIKKYFKPWNWRKSVEALLDYWFTKNEEIDKRIIKTITVLRKKGLKYYLAMNQEKYRTAYLNDILNFKNIFDYIFSSCNIGFKKPESGFYQYISNYLKENKIKTNEVLYWDDREKNMVTAKKFGFQTELYRNFEDFKQKVDIIL